MIVIVIVNWNGTEDTIECLESLMRTSSGEFRILVIDNGSDVHPFAAMQKWAVNGLEKTPSHAIWRQVLAGPRRHEVTLRRIDASEAWDANALVTLVEIGWNSGFAHANNVGIKMALDYPKVDYVWLLNNDTIVTPDTLGELVMTARLDPRYAIIGSTLVYYHHNDIVQGVGASYNLLTARTRQIANKSKYAELEAAEVVEPRIDFVIGASMFVTRNFVESAGLLDDRYFLYFEELDWAKRRQADQKLGWSPASIVYHKEGASIGTDSMNKNSATAVFYANRGLPLFYIKWHALLLPVVVLKIVFNVARYALRGDPVSARAAWRGAMSGFSAAFGWSKVISAESGPPHLAP